MWSDDEVRLIGIRLEKLTDTLTVQSSLFDTEKVQEKNNLEDTLDKLKTKYGNKIIKRAKGNKNEHRNNKRN